MVGLVAFYLGYVLSSVVTPGDAIETQQKLIMGALCEGISSHVLAGEVRHMGNYVPLIRSEQYGGENAGPEKEFGFRLTYYALVTRLNTAKLNEVSGESAVSGCGTIKAFVLLVL